MQDENAPAAMEKDTLSRLEKLGKLESWGEVDEAELLAQLLITDDAGLANAINAARALGQNAHAAFSSFKQLCRRRGPLNPEVLEQADRVKADHPLVAAKVDKELGYQAAMRARNGEERRRQAAGEPLSVVQPRCEHSIPALGYQPSWTLLVDETGGDFVQGGQGKGGMGRFVGLLVPPGCGLDELKSFHGAEASLEQVDDVVQRVLDAPVGIIGTTVENLPKLPGDRWTSGVLAVVGWVARLVPVNRGRKPAQVVLRVRVEQRGNYDRETSWDDIVKQLLEELARVDPERTRLVSIDLRFVDKRGHRFMGYVDGLAFTWGSPTNASKERLERTDLLRRCLLTADGPALRASWDHLAQHDHLDVREWSWLLSLAGADDPGSIPGALLATLERTCRSNPEVWHSYAGHVHEHLDSKAVDLTRLGRQVAWLDRAAPAGNVLTPRSRMVLLVARLAEANHRGETSQPDLDAELNALSERLFEEDASLVCQVDLHRAVLATNRFDFDLASSRLSRWQGLPRALPGIQLWGRVRSSLGQHAAFRGDAESAVAFFGEAIEAFEQLSDQRAAALDIAQTGTYLALMLIDDHAAPLDDVRAAVERITGPILTSVPRLACSQEPVDKYAQHLLLRYLAQRGDGGEQRAYLAQRAGWAVGDGHPWQLIELYRALLLRHADPRLASEHLARALERAFAPGQGWTVKFIGVTIATIAHGWGQEWPGQEAALASVVKALPKAQDRVEILRSALREPPPPLVLLKRVLPFNFR